MEKKIYVEITPFFPTNDSFRGPFIYDQVKALERTGRFSKILVLRPGKIWERKQYYVYDGIKVHLFPCLFTPSYILNGIFDSINQWLFKRWFKKNFEKYIPDIVIAHAHVSTLAIFPLVIKKMNSNIKAVIQHHDLDPFTIRNGKFAGQLWNLKYKVRRNLRLFGQLDCHLCVSTKVKESLLSFPDARKGEFFESYLSKLRKLKSGKMNGSIHAEVLYNGVDLRTFHPLSNVVKKQFQIGCIANFVELKGHATLLNAMRILILEKGYKDIYLSLVGSGPMLEECKTYVDKHQLSEWITFKTEMEHSKLCEYYNSLSLFVLPSFFEGLGCVFTEAAACGVPFMTCENQGIEDYILEGERGRWFFPAKDARKLATLIEQYKSAPVEQHLALLVDIDILIEDYVKKIML